MPSPRAYAKGIDGKMIPPGQTKIEYVQNFTNGEGLPSWLTINLGTGGGVAHSLTNRGYFAVTSAATAGSSAQLLTMPIPMNQYKAIMFEACGLQLQNSYTESLAADFMLEIANASPQPSAGGRFIHANGEPSAKFTVAGVGTTFPAGYTVRTLGESFKWRNIGMILFPDTKELIVFESTPEDVIAHCDASAVMASGLVRGGIQLRTQEAVAKTLRVSQVKLTLWQD